MKPKKNITLYCESLILFGKVIVLNENKNLIFCEDVFWDKNFKKTGDIYNYFSLKAAEKALWISHLYMYYNKLKELQLTLNVYASKLADVNSQEFKYLNKIARMDNINLNVVYGNELGDICYDYENKISGYFANINKSLNIV